MYKKGYVYILSNSSRVSFYIGVTSDIHHRIDQHINHEGSLWCNRYNVHDLVYCEVFDDISEAIGREKILKKYPRKWKINLIKDQNPAMETRHPDDFEFGT